MTPTAQNSTAVITKLFKFAQPFSEENGWFSQDPEGKTTWYNKGDFVYQTLGQIHTRSHRRRGRAPLCQQSLKQERHDIRSVRRNR